MLYLLKTENKERFLVNKIVKYIPANMKQPKEKWSKYLNLCRYDVQKIQN